MDNPIEGEVVEHNELHNPVELRQIQRDFRDKKGRFSSRNDIWKKAVCTGRPKGQVLDRYLEDNAGYLIEEAFRRISEGNAEGLLKLFLERALRGMKEPPIAQIELTGTPLEKLQIIQDAAAGGHLTPKELDAYTNMVRAEMEATDIEYIKQRFKELEGK